MSTTIPDKWLDYEPIGKVVEGTNIIACKVPLKSDFLTNIPQDSPHQFKPESLPELLKKLGKKVGLVIDLTYTTRYYHPVDIRDIKADYYKLPVPGREIPDECYTQQFMRVVDSFNAFIKEGGDPEAVIEEALKAVDEKKEGEEKTEETDEKGEDKKDETEEKAEEGAAAGDKAEETPTATDPEEKKENGEEKKENGEGETVEDGKKKEKDYFYSFQNLPDITGAIVNGMDEDNVDDYINEMEATDKVIVVHCTHGINRAGYMIARYMIDKLGKDPDEAIQAVNEARGHDIERMKFLQVLRDPELREMAKENASYTYLADRRNYQKYTAGQRFAKRDKPQNNNKKPGFKRRFNQMGNNPFRYNKRGRGGGRGR